ncbi:hypothetical protein P389DRAFT_167339 [Cystobasidium minutum MCA 4210]|uniref:uncharacterized protein n=1 Tax=Cystobasidium minutum MCA 4210 TaxID=1397322 RepID=UPI0034CE2223|eukprot:jgi/Rhomi1/167339/fgenesh1_kg.2_\
MLTATYHLSLCFLSAPLFLLFSYRTQSATSSDTWMDASYRNRSPIDTVLLCDSSSEDTATQSLRTLWKTRTGCP